MTLELDHITDDLPRVAHAHSHCGFVQDLQAASGCRSQCSCSTTDWDPTLITRVTVHRSKGPL